MTATANLQLELQNLSNDGIIVLEEFAKGIFDNIFYRNRDFLKMNSEILSFDKSVWEQNPHQFCLDQYSMVQLYPIILLVNNVKSIFEFTSEVLDYKIYAPSKSSIISTLTFIRI